MADQHSGDVVLLERAGPANHLATNGTPTTLVRATRTDPPYTTDVLISSLGAQPGTDFTLQEWDCDHMVPQARPADTAAVIREQLERVAMPAVTDEQVESVRALVASIPAGRVSTYGDIADAAGLSSPGSSAGSCAPTRRTCRGIG